MDEFDFYEFFAGGGMARIGLGPGWRCLFANDLSPKKARVYRANFGDGDLSLGDVHELDPAMLPGRADLAWGSFPCQDLSLAGARAGLSGARSGAFFGFMRIVEGLRREGRAPKLLALENVCGTLTARGGGDFAAIAHVLDAAGYRFGALVVDAAAFLPQSRPRLFILAVDRAMAIPPELVAPEPAADWTPRALRAAADKLPAGVAEALLWWRLPIPRANVPTLADIIEREPEGAAWMDAGETEALMRLMSPLHRARVAAIAGAGGRRVGTIYKRVRPDGAGGKTQRAEARFDGLAGCLRTPAGGSSRQIVIDIERGRVRTRLLTPREAARLMGLPDDYVLPARYNDAYELAGDGVAVPVVRHLASELIEPLLRGTAAARLAG